MTSPISRPSWAARSSGSVRRPSGAAAVVEADYAHIVIDTGSAGGTGAIRQVEGTEEGVPEGFRGAVAVEDVRGEHALVADAGRFLQGTAHGDDSLEGGDVVRGLLLLVG